MFGDQGRLGSRSDHAMSGSRLTGRCCHIANEIANDEVKLSPVERRSLVQLDCVTRGAIILRTCSANFTCTPLHTATYTADNTIEKTRRFPELI